MMTCTSHQHVCVENVLCLMLRYGPALHDTGHTNTALVAQMIYSLNIFSMLKMCGDWWRYLKDIFNVEVIWWRYFEDIFKTFSRLEMIGKDILKIFWRYFQFRVDCRRYFEDILKIFSIQRCWAKISWRYFQFRDVWSKIFWRYFQFRDDWRRYFEDILKIFSRLVMIGEDILKIFSI